MKKISIVSVASFVFLFLCSVTAKLVGLLFTSYVPPLIIGILLLALSAVLAIIFAQSTRGNIVCFFISSLAMGFLMRAWYIIRSLEPPILFTLLISLGAVLYLWILFALTRVPFIRHSKSMSVIVFTLYVILSITVYIFLVIKTETSFVSTIGYYMFLELSFILAMGFEANNRDELIRNLTLSTYSLFAVAGIVLVFGIITASGGDGCDCDCDGCDCLECCDGCDCDCGSSSHSSRKSKRKINTIGE